MADHWRAYVKEDFTIEPAGTGLLHGRLFAVKDVFGLAGWTNTAGNPDWQRTHGPSAANAPAVDLLLGQGARLQGIAHTDELMFSLNGENHHFGTPVNPRAKDRIPGGSSSGSAVAAASGAVDFGLGTDTGGSVRIPSAYCGLYGIRTTHGAVPLDGVIPLSASFDTVGWMSADARTLLDVGVALLGQDEAGRDGEEGRPGTYGAFDRLLFAEDAWSMTDDRCRKTVMAWLSRAGLAEKENGDWIAVAPDGLDAWFETFRTIQGYEIWQEHGDWIEREQPRFGPGIAERFAWSSTLERGGFERAQHNRQRIRAELRRLLGRDRLLVVPTMPGIAPKIGTTGEALEQLRKRTMQLSCIAGLGGFPQVTVPAGTVDGAPVAVSFIAGAGMDVPLLRWVDRVVSAAAGPVGQAAGQAPSVRGLPLEAGIPDAARTGRAASAAPAASSAGATGDARIHN
ncbi:amidase [Paenibacillus sacheonensis]|uniref:Amidase n=1 Tax=Paenibacillus sacheonensis TaxID=742054 RepID=A0A7X5BXJ8_9BACL|nr:amidase [Paenibacillus sacheonensis]MBM7566016.1 amidase [Paenibacillus sacheonensis]NBC68672.1 amidase [Paenibacillus sacheonensis]